MWRRRGDTFFSFTSLPGLINVKHRVRKWRLFRLFRFFPHSFPKICGSPCSNLLHKWTFWYSTHRDEQTHTQTHKFRHIMDVKKNCLVLSRRLGGKAAEKRILNHMDTSGRKTHQHDVHTRTHADRHTQWEKRLRVWEECAMTCRSSERCRGKKEQRSIEEVWAQGQSGVN